MVNMMRIIIVKTLVKVRWQQLQLLM